MGSAASDPAALPARYQYYWGTEFWAYVDAALRPGATVLDVGGGRKPTIAPDRRPEGVHYVGMDVSAHELSLAPAGSYDELAVADAQHRDPSLVGRFDLIVSWNVVEHIADLSRAAEVFRSYLRPGGWFVACHAGRHAMFALANRLLPPAVGARVVARLRRRPLDEVFPTHYDRCTWTGLHEAFADWPEVHAVALWHAADYFERLPRLQRLYLRYENWAAEGDHRDLATHYVLAARA